MSDPEVTKK